MKSATFPDAPPVTRKDVLGVLAKISKGISGFEKFKTRFRPFLCRVENVLNRIPSGSRIFDIGCGNGAFLVLAKVFRNADASHGCDVSAEAVEVFPKFPINDQSVQIRLLSPDQIPPDLRSYHVVTMIDVLHHIPKKRQDLVLSEVYRKMDPGAKLLLMDIDASKPVTRFLNQLHDLILARQWVRPRHPSEIRQLLNRIGAKIIDVDEDRTLWYSHYFIVAEKSDAA